MDRPGYFVMFGVACLFVVIGGAILAIVGMLWKIAKKLLK